MSFENFFTQKVWNTFMKDPYIQAGLANSGFKPITDVESGAHIAGTFALGQNYPNPFNPTTTIRFALPVEQRVRLVVYDLLGREVCTLIDGTVAPGEHRIEFGGTGLSSGVYLYRLATSTFAQTHTMVLLK